MQQGQILETQFRESSDFIKGLCAKLQLFLRFGEEDLGEKKVSNTPQYGDNAVHVLLDAAEKDYKEIRPHTRLLNSLRWHITDDATNPN